MSRSLRSLFAALGSVALLAGGVAFAGEDVAALFNSKCSNCHGKDGKGNEKMVAMLKLDAAALDLTSAAALGKSEADWVKITTEGEKKMPKFKEKLTAEQIGELVKYARGLGKK